MPTGLFSTYRQGENRVTSTFMAVLERLSLSNIDRVLQAILNESSFQLVQFENQVVGKHSVPDARISAASPVWFETKTTRNAIRSCAQIQDHLDSLANDERLLLLTPDDTIPSEVAVIDDQRLAWSNFRTLSEAIKSILEDENDPPTEREAFLLREFISLIEQEGLIVSPEDLVLVVAARNAWPEYKNLHAYICQPKRSFQAAAHIAFYCEGKIQGVIPRIVHTLEEATLEEELVSKVPSQVRGFAEDLLRKIDSFQSDKKGFTGKVLFLSSPESAHTLNLGTGVQNDLPTPFTYGHRYVSLKSLEARPETTSKLLELIR